MFDCYFKIMQLFFQEPTHLVVFDIAFKTDTYFDGALGVLKKVKYL